MRLIDAERFEELFDQQIELGATDLFDAVEDALQDTEYIDPETLPIVQELREQLAKVTAERDAAIADLKSIKVGLCDFCKYADGNICRCEEPCNINDNWEWRGIK